MRIVLTGLSVVLAAAAVVGAAGCDRRPEGTSSASAAANLNTAAAPTGLVISQVYGGAGSEGAPYNRDFVELFNRSKEKVSLAGLAIHFATSTGDFVPVMVLPNDVTVPPGGYYLLGFAAGLWGADLRVDFGGGSLKPPTIGSATLNLNPTNGKIALVRVADVDPTTAADASAAFAAQYLNCGGSDAGSCFNTTASARVLDLVGFGVATDHQGSSPSAPAARTKAVARKDGGCASTGNNGDDFESVRPTPRSSHYPVHICGGT